MALAALGCSGGVPAPPSEQPSTSFRAACLPAATPGSMASPWPPRDFDVQHWIGPQGSSLPRKLGAAKKLISEVGCPFQPAVIPRCDWQTLKRDEIPEPQSIAGTEAWRPGTITTVQGDLLVGHFDALGEPDTSKLEQRPAAVLKVCGLQGVCIFLGAPRAPECDFSPYWCMYDSSGVCCGYRFAKQVVVRGRIIDASMPAVEDALLCEL